MTAFNRSIELDDGKVGREVAPLRRSLRHDLGARVHVLVADRRQMSRVVELVVEHVRIGIAWRLRINAVTGREDEVVIDEHA